MRELSQYETAALIGYWRMGANSQCISYLFGIYPSEVERITEDYQIKNKL